VAARHKTGGLAVRWNILWAERAIDRGDQRMAGAETWIRYFDRPGPANTRPVLECCARRASELGLDTVVLASLRGKSALAGLDVFEGTDLRIVAVTVPPGAAWVVGSLNNDIWRDVPELREQKAAWEAGGLERVRMDMDEQAEARLSRSGVRVVRGTIPFYGIGTALASRFKGMNYEQSFTEALRLLSGGMIVCVEVAIMAADAGAIGTVDEVVVAAGTSMGLDTALVMRPSTSLTFLDPGSGLEIREVIAMPRAKPKYSPDGAAEEYM
jgi:uncharacterized protein